MNTNTRGRNIAAVAIAAGILLALVVLAAQSGGETFTATATVGTGSTSASAPVTIRIDRFIADADREKVVAAVKTNDPALMREALTALDDIGYIEVADRRTPIKYAYSRPAGGGRIVTVVAATPIAYLGGSRPDAKPKEGYDLALALLVLDSRDTGTGELSPAAKLRLNESGAIVTEEYGSEVVRLSGVTKTTQPSMQ